MSQRKNFDIRTRTGVNYLREFTELTLKSFRKWKNEYKVRLLKEYEIDKECSISTGKTPVEYDTWLHARYVVWSVNVCKDSDADYLSSIRKEIDTLTGEPNGYSR